MQWTPLRTREKYNNLKRAIDHALDDYWATFDPTEKPSYAKTVEACEKVVLTSFRLIKYIRKEIAGLDYQFVDTDKIGETGDAAVGFYSLSDNGTFKDETEVLEILSRSAFREMKEAKPSEDDIEEVWR